MHAALTVQTRPAAPVPPRDVEYILEATAALWPAMAGKRVFLTGGTGFFGKWLLESFLAANTAFGLKAQAMVLTRSPERFRTESPHLAHNEAVELLAGDVRDFAFPPGQFPFVVHAATESVPNLTAGRPEEMLLTIIEGTRRCLEFAASHGTTNFLLTSSGAVYGQQPPEMTHVREDYRGAPDPAAPNSSYGEGKRVAELLCALAAARTGIGCRIARCFAFVGPHLPLDAHFAIGNFIRDALGGGPVVIQGDGTPTRSYLYAADLAIWLWTMLFRGPSMRPLNVGSGRAYSIRQVAEAVVRTIAPQAQIHVAREAPQRAPIHRYVPCVDEAKRELGVQEGVDLENAIRRTAEWHGWKRPGES